jgi:DNA-binding response OmpR family regulator
MRKSVLIVDDEFGLADLLADMLTERGFEVRVAINGVLGMHALEAQPADLVLLDVMMPIMDGATMLRELRASERFAHIPVVMMTAVPRGVPVGAEPDAFLRKPFTTDELFEVLRRFLPE